MQEIEIISEDNDLMFQVRLNDFFYTYVLLDTGYSYTMLLPKEIEEFMYLAGKLSDKDYLDRENVRWGNVYTAKLQQINLHKLSIGGRSFSNLKVLVSNRYGGNIILGMGVMNKLKDFSIHKDHLCFDDGKEERIKIRTKVHAACLDYYSASKRRLKKLREERQKHPETDFRFNYKEWGLKILEILNFCNGTSNEDMKEIDKIIKVLTELRSLISTNLEFDLEHPAEKGAFLTAYLYLYLAIANFTLKRYNEALSCSEKAKVFFLPGSKERDEIDYIIEQSVDSGD